MHIVVVKSGMETYCVHCITSYEYSINHISESGNLVVKSELSFSTSWSHCLDQLILLWQTSLIWLNSSSTYSKIFVFISWRLMPIIRSQNANKKCKIYIWNTLLISLAIITWVISVRQIAKLLLCFTYASIISSHGYFSISRWPSPNLRILQCREGFRPMEHQL